MPEWLPPLAAASLACLILNVALVVQRARERAKEWPNRFRRDLRRWDGRLPERFESQANQGSDLQV
jgi:hypothetical protein